MHANRLPGPVLKLKWSEDGCFTVHYYYSIIQQATGNALDATSEGDIILYSYHGFVNQLWSWEDEDKTTLVNKKYNNKM